MGVRLANITFDCDNPLRVSAFWSAVLDKPVDPEASEFFCAIGAGGPEAGPTYFFIKVPEAKSIKNRLHLDLETDDPEAEVARLEELGATHVVDREEWGHAWSVFHDVEGNEFCVSGPHASS